MIFKIYVENVFHVCLVKVGPGDTKLCFASPTSTSLAPCLRSHNERLIHIECPCIFAESSFPAVIILPIMQIFFRLASVRL